VLFCEFFFRRFGPPGIRFTLWRGNDGGNACAVFADSGANADAR
jgi:hypothetical protein